MGLHTDVLMAAKAAVNAAADRPSSFGPPEGASSDPFDAVRRFRQADTTPEQLSEAFNKRHIERLRLLLTYAALEQTGGPTGSEVDNLVDQLSALLDRTGLTVYIS